MTKAKTTKPAKPLRVCNWGKPMKPKSFKEFFNWKKKGSKNFVIKYEFNDKLYKNLIKK